MRFTSRLLVLLVLLLVTTFMVGQSQSAARFTEGAYAPAFGEWTAKMASAISATGSQQFSVNTGTATTNDGVVFVPWVVGGKILVGGPGVAEVVQISAVSGCDTTAQPGLPATCLVTATSFANNHSIGEPIASADTGIMEAVGYSSAKGGGNVTFVVDCGNITLNTGGLTTTSTCFVPNTFINAGSSSRVTTTITVTASWAVGITGSTSAFSTANSTLTAGTTSIANQPAGTLVGTTTGLGAILITGATSNPGAGVIHVKVWGQTPAQSNF